MARGMPSMLALLGLAAFAGYQNRDKIASAMRDAQSRRDTPGAPQSGLDSALAGLGDLLQGGGLGGMGGSGRGMGGGLGELLQGAGASGGLRGGLGELLDNFRSSGHQDAADSWVRPGPNKGLTPDEVERAVGEENIRELSQRTGLSRDDLLQRLATNLPETVDRLTPDGQLPETDEDLFRRLT